MILPAKVARPWGSYETVADGPRFQVKHIIVDPGETLSLQMHYPPFGALGRRPRVRAR